MDLPPPGTAESVLINEVSTIWGCPYRRVPLYLDTMNKDEKKQGIREYAHTDIIQLSFECLQIKYPILVASLPFYSNDSLLP